MARTTIAQLQAEIAELRAALVASPASPTVASAHWKARDIACPRGAACTRKDGTVRTFRTDKGLASHKANFPDHFTTK